MSESAPSAIEDRQRSAGTCMYCGHVFHAKDTSEPEVARVYHEAIEHDRVCSGNPLVKRIKELEAKLSHVAPLDQVSAIRKQAFLDAEAICIQVRDRAVMSKFATRDHCTEYRSAAWECACSLRAMADAAPANVAPFNPQRDKPIAYYSPANMTFHRRDEITAEQAARYTPLYEFPPSAVAPSSTAPLRTLGEIVPEHDPVGFAGTVLTNDDPDISPVWKAVCRALVEREAKLSASASRMEPYAYLNPSGMTFHRPDEITAEQRSRYTPLYMLEVTTTSSGTAESRGAK